LIKTLTGNQNNQNNELLNDDDQIHYVGRFTLMSNGLVKHKYNYQNGFYRITPNLNLYIKFDGFEAILEAVQSESNYISKKDDEKEEKKEEDDNKDNENGGGDGEEEDDNKDNDELNQDKEDEAIED
jgi:hypothetical protein